MVVSGVLGLIALGVVLASLVYLHVAPTGLSPLRNAVSQYGITAYRTGYRIAAIAFGVAGIAVAAGIEQAEASHEPTAVLVLLAIFALSRGAISWYPMDAPGTPQTATGRAHGRLAVAAFVSVGAAAFELGRVLSQQQLWHGLAATSTGLGWVMLALLLAMALGRSQPVLRANFGLVERAFYVSAIAWFTVFAVACALRVQ